MYFYCFVTFPIVNCGSPLHLISDLTDMITDNNYPAVEGTTARFSCSSGYVLTGSSTAICMGNGEWVPDPRQVQCEGIIQQLLLGYTIIIRLTSCMQNHNNSY